MRQQFEKPVLLFDGVCNLCNYWVNFVIDRDPEGRVMFAALQSDAGRQLLMQYNLDPEAMDTVVLIDNGKVYQRSDAIIRLSSHMKGGVRLLRTGVVFPRFVRDVIYNAVARKRYKWFGKRDQCRMPDPELKGRFLEMNPPAGK